MYESYWGLSSNPFRAHADTEFFYGSPTHQAALMKLRYAIENRKEAGLLIGGYGSGKTLLLKVLAEQLPGDAGPLVHLIFPALAPEELLRYLVHELGEAVPARPRASLRSSHLAPEPEGIDRSIAQLRAQLRHNAERGKHAVLVIDEAQTIDDPRVFDLLRLLLNLEVRGQPPFTLLLVGHTEFLCRLERHGALEERLAVKCMLRPLSIEETTAYVSHRLETAGATCPIFEPDAISVLHECSGGVPRRINRIADLALLVGYADSGSSISPSQVEAVAEEMSAVMSE